MSTKPRSTYFGLGTRYPTNRLGIKELLLESVIEMTRMFGGHNNRLDAIKWAFGWGARTQRATD
jgi:hypothetical protein